MSPLDLQSARNLVNEGLTQRAADIAAGRPSSFTIASLREIAERVSVALPDTVDTFVFYSGGYLGTVSAEGAAEALRDQAPENLGSSTIPLQPSFFWTKEILPARLPKHSTSWLPAPNRQTSYMAALLPLPRSAPKIRFLGAPPTASPKRPMAT